MQIAIIGADERTPALKRCLTESGIGIIEITEQNIRRLMQSQIIVLPLRALEEDGRIRGSRVKIGMVLSYAAERSVIYGGCFPEVLTRRPSGRRIRLVDYMEDEVFRNENAGLTAEGCLVEAMTKSRCCVKGRNCLVAGFGYCGRAMAKLLLSLEAEVTVYDIKEDCQRVAMEMGCSLWQENAEEQNFEWIEDGENGNEAVNSSYQVVTDNDRLFALRIDTSIVMAGSNQYTKIYNIDKKTGNTITLNDLFQKDSDYLDRISEEIEKQMKENMEKDSNLQYFLDKDVDGYSFDGIKNDVNFYVNKEGELTIVFDKYEVAPGYMGIVEFTIPTSVVSDIIKDGYLQ